MIQSYMETYPYIPEGSLMTTPYPLRFELGMALSTSSSFKPTDYRVTSVDYAHANSFTDTLPQTSR